MKHLSSPGLHREAFRREVELCYEARQPLTWGEGDRSATGSRTRVRAPAGVVDHWPEDLVVRVGAGSTFAEVDDFLRPWELELGVLLPQPDRTTLGGAFARGEGGMTGGGARSLRELALSALLVEGRGRPLELGTRVVKNVAGYDLLRPHFGAGGAWGGLCELVVRSRSRPPSRMLRWSESSPQEALGRLQQLRDRGSTTTVGEWWLDAAALARLGLEGRGGWFLLAEGSEQEVGAWADAVGGEESTDALPILRDLGWTESSAVLVRVFASTRECFEGDPAFASGGGGRGWIHDAATGVNRWILADLSDLDRVSRRLGPMASRAFVDRGPIPAATRPAGGRTAEWKGRLRQIYDPGEIFPPLPTPLGP